jgi:hypothetical protein
LALKGSIGRSDIVTLGDLIKELEKHDPEKVVPVGFHHPYSYRGYYELLAFEPKENTTVGEMLQTAKSALGATFIGWKGGEFTIDEHTVCYIAVEGTCWDSDLIGPILLKYMLGETENEKVEGKS